MSSTSLEIVLTAINNTKKTFGEVTDGLKNISSAGERMKSIGSTMNSIGQKMTVGISAPLIGIGAAALKASADLNSSLANVQALGVAEDTIRSMRSQVKEMAVDYGRSSIEISDGLYQVVSALGESADNTAQLDQVMQTAVAGAATTTDSINLLALVTKGYGDTSSEAMGKVSDLALETVRLGQTTFPELASALGSVVPLASELGIEMESMFAVMATATGVTGSTSEVSTQLRGILQSLLAPTKNMSAALDEMGFASGDAAIEAMGLGGVIKAVAEAAEASGQPLQSYIGSIEGQTLAMNLAGEGAAKFEASQRSLGSATGATTAAFEAQTTGVNEAGFAASQARESMRNLSDSIGTVLSPSLTSASEAINRFATAMSGFAESNPKIASFAAGIGGIAVVVGPAIIAIGALVGAVGTIVTVFSAGGALAGVATFVGGIMAAIAGFFSLPVVAAIALGAAFATLAALTIKHWSSIKSFVSSGVSSIVSSIRGMVSTVLSTLSNLASQAFAKGRAVVDSIANGIKASIGKVRDAAASVTSAVAGMLPGSPVDYGPLTVLNGNRNAGFRISEMVADGINRGRSQVQSSLGSAINPPQPSGATGSSGMTNHIHVTVNATGGNPDAIAKATKDELRDLFRSLYREYQSEQIRVSYG